MQTCPNCGFSYLDHKVAERKELFYNELVKYIGIYPKEMIRAFFDYWSETNANGKKMRFEMEKTWDLERRLSRWSKNNFNKPKRTLESIREESTNGLQEFIKNYE